MELIYLRMQKYIPLNNSKYECPICHATIMQRKVSVSLWDGVLPGGGGGGDFILTPSIPFCPNCETIPWKDGTPLAPRGSYCNPDMHPDPCWLILDKDGWHYYSSAFSSQILAEGFAKEQEYKDVHIEKVPWDELVNQLTKKGVVWIAIDPMWRFGHSNLIRVKKNTEKEH
jgi:hypothetical protein